MALRGVAPAVAVGAVCVLFGILLVVRRTPDAADEALRIRGDALYYLAAARSEAESIPAPFRYRFLVPWLASVLPGSELSGLTWITLASMGATFAATFGLARRVGSSAAASVVGLALVVASPWSLYAFHNPLLTDGAAHAVIAAEVWALVAGATLPFAVLVTIGAGVRETTGVLAPALWSAGHRRHAVVLTAGVVLVFVAWRVLDGDGNPPAGALAERLTPAALAQLTRSAVTAWSGLWLLAPTGLLMIAGDAGSRLRRAAAWLLLGGTLSALLAADAGRMLAVLLVPFGVGAATAVDALLRQRRRAIVSALVAAAIVNACAWVPNRVFPLESAAFRATELRLVACAASLLSAAAAAVALIAERRRRQPAAAD